MSGPFLDHFRLYLIDSTKVISSKVAKFGSMDIVELHGDILPTSIDYNKRTRKEIVTNQLAAPKAKVFFICAFYALYSN